MKLVTFNIRYDCGHDGKNNFSFRKSMILEKLQVEKPDIICFQEVLPHVAPWLKTELTDYYVVGCPRSEVLDDEQTCIAYRKNSYNLIKMDTYWLSPTPNIPGSRYEVQSICPRVCTELTLQELSSQRIFRLINTHFDHEGAPARLLAAKQILGRLESATFFPDIPAILTGDLNAEPDSEEIRLLSENMENVTRNVGITFHNFGRGENIQIDYIFTKGPVRCTHTEKWTDCRDGVYLSDHYPVCAELFFA